jgi:glucose/mannose-6-phosphate isomerase
MINSSYYNDIKQFPQQFKIGFDLARGIKVEGKFDRVVLCAMGGSGYYVELINDYLASLPGVNFRLEACRSYNLPTNVGKETLFMVVSYSGGTEEALSCLEEIKQKGYSYCAITSGSKLLQDVQSSGAQYVKVPAGIQPRLSTGYFIGSVLKILANQNFIPNLEDDVLKIVSTPIIMDEDKIKELAAELVDRMPVIYTTDNNTSLGRIVKIKFNENSKVQAFSNYFPELNHNEMVGFTRLVTKPYFIIFKSKFTHPRNVKRIETFVELMAEKGLKSYVMELPGDSILEEILFGYHYADYLTYYLAEAYGVDPEPVEMVEKFKQLIS